MVGTQCPPGTFQPVLVEEYRQRCCVSAQYRMAESNRQESNRLRCLAYGWEKVLALTGKHRVGVEPTKQPHFKRNFRLNQSNQKEGTVLM